MKVYTKTGDKGETSLFGGKRVKKYHDRINAYGTIDELNSYIGLVGDQMSDGDKKIIKEIQDRLFTIGSILAADPEKPKLKKPDLLESDVAFLEATIDTYEENLPSLQYFILPGGHTSVSFCHIARCVCRRAERLVIDLSEKEVIDEMCIVYLNRLSDFLFVLARKMGQDLGVEENKWMPRN